MKRIFAFVMAGLMATSLLAGCGGGKTAESSATSQETGTKTKEEAKTEGTDKKKFEGVTLTFGSHQSGLPTTGVVQNLAKDFEAETGVKIDFQISPDAQWRDLIKVKLNSGEAPDIFCVDADPLSLNGRISPEENCVSVTDEEFVKRMDPNVLPSISYNNQVYGITFPGKKMYYYVYNKDIFKELNLQVPKNYEEFKKVCQTIKAAGITPVYEATQNGWHQVLPLFESGPMYAKKHEGLYDKMNKNEMNLDDIPELLTIIKQLKECADLGYYGDNFLSNTFENAKAAFANREAAMVMAETGWAFEVIADFPEMKLEQMGIFVMPWGDNQIVGVNPASNAYFINKKGKNTEAAMEFFRFLARPENLQKRLDGQPGILDVCWPEVPSRYPEEFKTYIDSLEKGTVMQAAVSYVDSQWMEVGKDLEDMYVGAITPEQLVKIIADRRDEQAQLQKDPAWAK